MEKDKTIIELIQKLKLTINFSLIQVVDYWDADFCAIGLKRDRKLVYISTYNYCNKKKIKYDFDFEIIDNEVEDKTNLLKERRGVSEVELIFELKEFLSI